MEELEWLDIDLLNGFSTVGSAKYCINSHEVTVALDGIYTPKLDAKSAVIFGKIPETLFPSSKLEVREVTLLSNGNVANVLITAEGNIIFETPGDIESLTSFSCYKIYLKD